MKLADNDANRDFSVSLHIGRDGQQWAWGGTGNGTLDSGGSPRVNAVVAVTAESQTEIENNRTAITANAAGRADMCTALVTVVTTVNAAAQKDAETIHANETEETRTAAVAKLWCILPKTLEGDEARLASGPSSHSYSASGRLVDASDTLTLTLRVSGVSDDAVTTVTCR